MAEINQSQMVSDRIVGQKPGTQALQIVVWPKGEPAKIVTSKSAETGKEIKTPIARIPLCRMLGNVSDFRGWRLSAFWEDFRWSTCAYWEFVPDVEEVAKGDAEAGHVQAIIEVEGATNTKPGFTKWGKSKLGVTWDDIPYKWNDTKGFFGFDRQTMKTLPLTLGGVMRLREALRNQIDNPDTCGTRDDNSKPKILWTPWALHGNKAEMKESEVFAENFDIFKSWAGKDDKPGKIVGWELEKVPQ